jgi:hypothetical protein
MLIDAYNCFSQLVQELVRRVRIESQDAGWAVVIDGEVATWAVSESRAQQLAVELIESGI